MNLYSLFGVLIAVILFVAANFYPPLGIGGSLFLIIAILSQWYRQGYIIQRTRLDWPLALFLFSGFISLWAAYDFSASLTKFGLIGGGIGLYYALGQASLRQRIIAAYLLVILAGSVAIIYTLQQSSLLKPTVDTYSSGHNIYDILATLETRVNLYQNYHNEIAGFLEIALLIGVGLLMMDVPQTSRFIPTETIYARFMTRNMVRLSLLFIILGLTLTGSRGALMALSASGLGWLLSSNIRRNQPQIRVMDGLAVVIILGSAFWLLSHRLQDLAWLETDVVRLNLYLDSRQLVQDFLFTGAGLASFPLLYSTYVLGLDVIFLYHAHNLYLSVWLEQGLWGLVALLWLGITLLRHYPQRQPMKSQETLTSPDLACLQNRLVTAAGWATATIFLHGLVDSPHYNSLFLPMMFVPLGLSGPLFYRPRTNPNPQQFRLKMPQPQWIAVASLIIVTLIVGRSLVLSSLYANLGAVKQAKIELGQYRWPDRIPSKVRPAADLSQPVALFEQALRLSPQNTTAQRRLEMIHRATTLRGID